MRSLRPTISSASSGAIGFGALSQVAQRDRTGAVAEAGAGDPVVIALYGFTLLYSTTGGLRSVVRTDLGQLAILGVATLGYAWIAAEAAGGVGELGDALASAIGAERSRELLAFDPWNAASVGGTFVAVLGLQWLVQMNSDGTGYLAQRCIACRSPEDARRLEEALGALRRRAPAGGLMRALDRVRHELEGLAALLEDQAVSDCETAARRAARVFTSSYPFLQAELAQLDDDGSLR